MVKKAKAASSAANTSKFNSTTEELIPVLKSCWQFLHDGETDLAAITAAVPDADRVLVKNLVQDVLTTASPHHAFLKAMDKVEKDISVAVFAEKEILPTPAKGDTPKSSLETKESSSLQAQRDTENFSDPDFEPPKIQEEVKLADHLIRTRALEVFKDLTGAAHIKLNNKFYNLSDKDGLNALTRICKEFGRVGTFVSNVKSALEAEALDAETIPVFLRTAPYKDEIVINPCWESGQVIHIRSDGYSIIDMPVDAGFVFLHRDPAIHAMPVPVAGGDIEKLQQFLNLDNSADFRLVPAVVASLLLPKSPLSGCYPIVVFTGEKGTAKTTAAELMKSIIDPSELSEGIKPPKETRTLFVHARREHIVYVDNVNTLTEDQSADYSRLVQGAGHVERGLYTNMDATVFKTANPVLMTAIDSVTTKTDLVDRSYVFKFAFIPDTKRKEKEVIKSEFAEYAPELLGLFLDGLVSVLKNKAEIRKSDVVMQEGLPRNADNAIALISMAKVFNSTHEDMHAALLFNTNEADRKIIEDCVWADRYIKFISSQLNGKWEGTNGNLLDILTNLEIKDRTSKPGAPANVTPPDGWPKTPLLFAKSMNAVLPSLRKIYGAEKVEINKAKRIHVFSANSIYLNEDAAPSDNSTDNNVAAGEQIKLK